MEDKKDALGTHCDDTRAAIQVSEMSSVRKR